MNFYCWLFRIWKSLFGCFRNKDKIRLRWPRYWVVEAAIDIRSPNWSLVTYHFNNMGKVISSYFYDVYTTFIAVKYFLFIPILFLLYEYKSWTFIAIYASESQSGDKVETFEWRVGVWVFWSKLWSYCGCIEGTSDRPFMAPILLHCWRPKILR